MTLSPADSYRDLLIGGICVPVNFTLRLNESLFKLIVVIWMQSYKIFNPIPNLGGIERRVEWCIAVTISSTGFYAYEVSPFRQLVDGSIYFVILMHVRFIGWCYMFLPSAGAKSLALQNIRCTSVYCNRYSCL